MRTHTASFCSGVIETQCATSTTVRPQPRQTSSKVVEHTATHGVSARCAAGAPCWSRGLSCGADIEFVPAFVTELFERVDILFEDLGGVGDRFHGAVDA